MISLMLIPSEINNKLTLYCCQGTHKVKYSDLNESQKEDYDAFLNMVQNCNMGEINFGANQATIEGMIPVEGDPIDSIFIDEPTESQLTIINNLLTNVFLITDGI